MELTRRVTMMSNATSVGACIELAKISVGTGSSGHLGLPWFTGRDREKS